MESKLLIIFIFVPNIRSINRISWNCVLSGFASVHSPDCAAEMGLQLPGFNITMTESARCCLELIVHVICLRSILASGRIHTRLPAMDISKNLPHAMYFSFNNASDNNSIPSPPHKNLYIYISSFRQMFGISFRKRGKCKFPSIKN